MNWDVRTDLVYFCTLLSVTKVLPLAMEVPDFNKTGEILKQIFFFVKKKAKKKMEARHRDATTTMSLKRQSTVDATFDKSVRQSQRASRPQCPAVQVSNSRAKI